MRFLRTSALALLGLLLAPVYSIGWGVACLVRPSLRYGLGERLGDVTVREPGSVWVHGASMGEARVVVSILGQFTKLGLRGYASTMTENGRNVLERETQAVPFSYLPVDHPWCVGRALDRVRPAALVIVETELWPFLILAASAREIPVLIASGRISQRSYARYSRVRLLVAAILRRVDGVSARTPLDAGRFIALGVPEEKVVVLGDVKLDPGASVAHLATDLVRATASVPVFVAGSTHPGEEEAALSALAACESQGCELALVIAPRHLERIDEVEKLVVAKGRRVRRRSALDGGTLANGDVLLLDSRGELAALYAAASMAFVGGTIARVGGHNLLEPLFEGCPVVFGPDLCNVRENAQLAIESGAGVKVQDARGLAGAITTLALDLKDARSRGDAAKQFLNLHRGTSELTARWIEEQSQARVSS